MLLSSSQLLSCTMLQRRLRPRRRKSNLRLQSYNRTGSLSRFFFLWFILLLLQNFLQRFIGAFKYYDEIFVVLSMFALPKFIKEKKYKINKYDKIILYSMLSMIAIGCLGNLIFKYQVIRFVIADLIVFSKFIIALYYFKILLQNYELGKNEKLYEIIIYITNLFITLTVLNYILNMFPGEIRYGIKTNQGIFTHPTFLAASCAFMYILVSMSNVLSEKNKKLTMVKLLILLVTTLRSKAFVFVILAMLLYYIIIVKNKKITVKIIMMTALIASAISINQISYYFFNKDNITARAALTTTSIKIATEHFPIGAGFGTFGSDASRINYSPIYEKYNIHKIWGLREGDGRFVSDNFWPMLIGQFGYTGLICYIAIVITLFKMIQKVYNQNKKNYTYYGAILALLYLLISSTTESAFVNPISIMYALVIGYVISSSKEKDDEKKLKS